MSELRCLVFVLYLFDQKFLYLNRFDQTLVSFDRLGQILVCIIFLEQKFQTIICSTAHKNFIFLDLKGICFSCRDSIDRKKSSKFIWASSDVSTGGTKNETSCRNPTKITLSFLFFDFSTNVSTFLAKSCIFRKCSTFILNLLDLCFDFARPKIDLCST